MYGYTYNLYSTYSAYILYSMYCVLRICVCTTVPQEIDQKEENIKLARTEAVMSPADLKACIPDSTARYHFYLFNHKYQEDFFNSVG